MLCTLVLIVKPRAKKNYYEFPKIIAVPRNFKNYVFPSQLTVPIIELTKAFDVGINIDNPNNLKVSLIRFQTCSLPNTDALIG